MHFAFDKEKKDKCKIYIVKNEMNKKFNVLSLETLNAILCQIVEIIEKRCNLIFAEKFVL